MIEISDIRQAAETIGKKYGIERIYLFGSYARGDATDTSDIDLRIDRGRVQGLMTLAGVYLDFQKALDKKIDVFTTDSLKDSFLKVIEDDEVLLYVA